MRTASIFRLAVLLIGTIAIPLAVFANGSCPAIGNASSCGALITIGPTGKLSLQVDPNVGPYDGNDDSLVGIINNSGATVYGVTLNGPGIFAFDGDGICIFVVCNYPNPTTYEGPLTSFSKIDANSGVVNFIGGLPNGGFLYFGLEGPPSNVKLTSTVTLDPGHGTNCPAKPSNGQSSRGAQGDKIYPGLPPPGYLQEDLLTVPIAIQTQNLLTQLGYKVYLTKSDTASCPTFQERADTASQRGFGSNILVSIHVNKPVTLSALICGTGSSVLYNDKASVNQTLAQYLIAPVALNIGAGILQTTFLCFGDNTNVNHDGTYIRDGLALLKLSLPPTALVETARLSEPDEDIVHGATFTGDASRGISEGIDVFVNQ